MPGATKDSEELKIQVPELVILGFIELDSGELQNQDRIRGAQEERNEDIILIKILKLASWRLKKLELYFDNEGCDNYVSTNNPKTKRPKRRNLELYHKESRHIIKRT